MRRALLLVLAGTAALAGCVGSDTEEIRQWMAQERAATKPKVQPIPEPRDDLRVATNVALAVFPGDQVGDTRESLHSRG